MKLMREGQISYHLNNSHLEEMFSTGLKHSVSDHYPQFPAIYKMFPVHWEHYSSYNFMLVQTLRNTFLAEKIL